ncbi:MAG: spore coat associated protein CotJA [Ruminococcaceae bacterium]|nr:spore coat associated protein CotJA [Oscillospiraceae bacterium]
MEKIKDDCFYDGVSVLPKELSVAMAYIPFQQDTTEYDVETALKRGTLFVVLDKPFTGVKAK